LSAQYVSRCGAAAAPVFIATSFRVGVIVIMVALLFLIPWRRKRVERRQGAVAATASAALALLSAALSSGSRSLARRSGIAHSGSSQVRR